MPDLPDVNENFTADNSDFIAKVQEMIDKVQELSDQINELTGSVDDLHASIDALPDQKEIRIAITGLADEYVDELHAALDDLPMDKEIYVQLVGEALAQVEALNFALDELPKDKIIDVTIVYNEIGKPTSLELPEASVKVIEQGAQEALTGSTQALEQGAGGTAYSAEVLGAQGLADAMGEISAAAPYAAEGVERLGITAGQTGIAAQDLSGAVEDAGLQIEGMTSPERIAALEQARDILANMAQAQREIEGVPAEGTPVIKGIPIEDFLGPEELGPEEGEGAGDEFADAAARAVETEAASAGMSDLAKQLFGGPVEDDLTEQGVKDADSWFKGLVAGLTTKAINPDDIPHLPGVNDGKGATPGTGGSGGGGSGGSLYQGMFEGVIVAAAAAAPFIAQALSGALTAGLGFALAGLGIYAAMQLAPVKAAFKDFEDTAKNDLAGIGKIFEPVMLSIFHVATEVFGVLTPVFAEAERTIAGPFKVWADTFIKTFENPAVEASIEAVAQAFASILKVVTPELAGMAEKFAGALIALVNNIGSHPQATADFLNFLAEIPTAILTVLNALTSIAEYMETHPLFSDLAGINVWENMIHGIVALLHGDFLTALKDFGASIGDTFKDLGKAVIDGWDMLPQGFRHGTDQIVDDIRKAFEAIPGIVKKYWDDAVKAVSGGWDDIVNALFGDSSGGGIASKASGIFGDLESVWNNVVSATKTAWDTVKDAVMVPWNATVSFVESLGNSFSSWWATHGQALEEVWDTTWGVIKGLTQEAWNIVEGIIRTGVSIVSAVWDTFWNALSSTAREAWNIIGPVVTTGWDLIKNAFNAGGAGIDLIWNTLWSVIEAVAKTAWDAVAALVKIGWDLVTGVFDVGVAALKAVWNVLWSAVEAVAKTAWDAVVALLKVGWDLIVGVFSVFLDVITGHWSQAWQDIKSTAEQIWNAISGFFEQAFNNYASFFESVWNNIKNFWDAWWGDVKTVGEQIWNAISSFFEQAFNNFYSMFEQVFNNVKNFFDSVWSDIESDAKDVWGGIMGFFDGIWSDLRSGFDNVVDSIQSAWNRLDSIFQAPVNFLVHTVYDNGIRRLWNDVMGAIGGPSLPSLSTGAKLPGYGGGDIIPALLEPGETVVSKEHSKLLATAFRDVGVPGYSSGGTAPPGTPAGDAAGIAAATAADQAKVKADGSGGGILGDIGGFLGDIGSFFKDAASITAAVLTGNTGALANDLSKFIGTGGASAELATMITGIPKTIVKQLVRDALSIGSAYEARTGPAGGTTGSDMANGLELYNYLLKNVFAGHKIAAAGATASIWGESGWDPFAVGTGGRGLIGWTPVGTISNAAFEGGMKTQLPAIIQFIDSSGDWGVIQRMEGATSVAQAASEWGLGVERYGISDVHAEGIALATSFMNAASPQASQGEANALAKAAQTHDAGGWLYPGMNLIENKTGQIERSYPAGQGPGGEGGLIHNVLNVDGKTIFEAVKPYVYQYNSRNSGNGRVNGTWRPN